MRSLLLHGRAHRYNFELPSDLWREHEDYSSFRSVVYVKAYNLTVWFHLITNIWHDWNRCTLVYRSFVYLRRNHFDVCQPMSVSHFHFTWYSSYDMQMQMLCRNRYRNVDTKLFKINKSAQHWHMHEAKPISNWKESSAFVKLPVAFVYNWIKLKAKIQIVIRFYCDELYSQYKNASFFTITIRKWNHQKQNIKIPMTTCSPMEIGSAVVVWALLHFRLIKHILNAIINCIMIIWYACDWTNIE